MKTKPKQKKSIKKVANKPSVNKKTKNAHPRQATNKKQKSKSEGITALARNEMDLFMPLTPLTNLIDSPKTNKKSGKKSHKGSNAYDKSSIQEGSKSQVKFSNPDGVMRKSYRVPLHVSENDIPLPPQNNTKPILVTINEERTRLNKQLNDLTTKITGKINAIYGIVPTISSAVKMSNPKSAAEKMIRENEILTNTIAQLEAVHEHLKSII